MQQRADLLLQEADHRLYRLTTITFKFPFSPNDFIVGITLAVHNLVDGLPFPSQDSACYRYRVNLDNLKAFSVDLNKSVASGLSHEVSISFIYESFLSQ